MKGALVFVQGELTTREYDRTIKVTVSKKPIDHVIQQLVVELKADAVRVLDRSSNPQSDAAEPRTHVAVAASHLSRFCFAFTARITGTALPTVNFPGGPETAFYDFGKRRLPPLMTSVGCIVGYLGYTRRLSLAGCDGPFSEWRVIRPRRAPVGDADFTLK